MSASGRLVPAAVLAVPFLVAIAALKGLTVEIDTFHGTDAGLYHLPTIRQFAHHVDLESYPAAQTPLYHLLFAGFGKVAGFELWKLRLLNAAISYGAALALLRLLRRATPLEPVQALALTLVFVLSPYFFGASFTLLTDNLALLFAFLALERIESFRRSASLGTFAAACLAICAAVLTRQSFVWLAPVAAVFLLLAPMAIPRKVAGLALVGAALAPLGALVVVWDGLVPKGSDPGSCGLCGDQPGGGGLTLRPVGFTLALFGAYAAVLFGPSLVRRARRLRSQPALVRRAWWWLHRPEVVRRAWVVLGGVAVAGLALLLVSPLTYEPNAPGRPGDGGWLWKLADRAARGGGLLARVLRPRARGDPRARRAGQAGGDPVAAGGGVRPLPAGRPARAARLPEVLRPDGAGHPRAAVPPGGPEAAVGLRRHGGARGGLRGLRR